MSLRTIYVAAWVLLVELPAEVLLRPIAARIREWHRRQDLAARVRTYSSTKGQ